jgi:hypothetical protein
VHDEQDGWVTEHLIFDLSHVSIKIETDVGEVHFEQCTHDFLLDSGGFLDLS